VSLTTYEWVELQIIHTLLGVDRVSSAGVLGVSYPDDMSNCECWIMVSHWLEHKWLGEWIELLD